MKKNNEVNYFHSEEFHNEKAALEILPYLQSVVEFKSIIDIGCGTGSWLSAAKKTGVNEVFGIDGIRVKDEMLKIEDTEFKLHNLTKPLNLNRKFDLAICLEVVEHLPHEAAENIIDIITQHSNLVLFAAAIPYQTGDHHINEQWPNYWQQVFLKKGFYPYDILRAKFWENDNIDWWYRQNMVIYCSEKSNSFLGESDASVLSLVHPELLKMKETQVKWETQTLKSLLKSKLRSLFN